MKSIYIVVLFVGISFTIKGQQTSGVSSNFLQNTIELNETLDSEISVKAASSIVFKLGFSSNGNAVAANIVSDPDFFKLEMEESIKTSKNYSRKIVPKIPVKYLGDFNFLTTDQVIEQINYTDGLGRKTQTHVMGTVDQGDYMVQFYSYDKFGRVDTSYLPFTHNSEGVYLDNARTLQETFYKSRDTKAANENSPFSTSTYESSPLSRVIETATPGDYWKTHTIKSDYITNLASDNIRKWTSVAGNYTGTTTYPENSLYKNIVTDENGKTVTSYTDKDGKLILRDQEGLQTYYIYDKFGRMVHILPPEFVEQLATVNYTVDASNTLVQQYCYTYVYGERNLLGEKYLPGIYVVEYVYDNLNRPVLSRNGELKDARQWSFIKYDKFSRVVYSGIWTDGSATPLTRAQLQTAMNSETDLYEEYDASTDTYSSNVYPGNDAGIDIHVTNIYDTYPATVTKPFVSKNRFDAAKFANINGMMAVSRVKILETNNYLEKYYYYDKKGQLIQVHADNIFEKIDISCYRYNFMGQIETLMTEHEKPDATLETVTKYYTYNHAGRLANVEQEIKNDTGKGKVKMLEMEYNKLGQVKTKKLHGTGGNNFLQNIDYQYNIRGLLTQINDPDNQGNDKDLFAMRLHYNDKMLATSRELNNGMISGMEWTIFDSNIETKKRAYNYIYDDHYRLLEANYSEGTILNENIGRYDVDYTYTGNGKINSLVRNGKIEDGIFGIIDNLSYTYNGNQLVKVDDTGITDTQMNNFADLANLTTEYEYDKNGNMYSDANKELTQITYNHLNLPQIVDFGSNNKIIFTYDALGSKLKKEVVVNGTITNIFTFAGSFVYHNNVLSQIATEEGHVSVSGTTYKYEYFLKDHLGSVRAMFDEDVNGNAQLLQETHYYPYGMRIDGLTFGSNNNKLFSGKELNSDQLTNAKLNWCDFHARNYDPQLGMWFNVDPLAEKYHSHTPYNYCYNNPVNFTDPTGMGSGPLIYVLENFSTIPDGTTWYNDGSNGGRGRYTYGNGFEIGVAYKNRFNSWGNNDGFTGSPLNMARRIARYISNTGYAGTFSLEIGNKAFGINVQDYIFLITGQTIIKPRNTVAQSNGVGQINFMDNLNNSARHLIRAIKYSMENGGNGVVNIDEIFSNYNPNTNAGAGQGFDRSFQMTINGKDLALKIHFSTPVGANTGCYDPIIDFSYHNTSQTSKSFKNGYYFHDFYLGGGRSKYGPRIGVGDIRPNLWDNFTYFGEWIGYW